MIPFFCCSKACPIGFHGHRCQLLCDCRVNAPCDPGTGRCLCPPGYQGLRCDRGAEELLYDVDDKLYIINTLYSIIYKYKLKVYFSECDPGKFGPNCVHKCDCDGDAPCDPVSGRCLCAPGKMGSRCDIGKPSTFHLHESFDLFFVI